MNFIKVIITFVTVIWQWLFGQKSASEIVESVTNEEFKRQVDVIEETLPNEAHADPEQAWQETEHPPELVYIAPGEVSLPEIPEEFLAQDHVENIVESVDKPDLALILPEEPVSFSSMGFDSGLSDTILIAGKINVTRLGQSNRLSSKWIS